MNPTRICPFYGQNEDACDVGCGYITSHDAKMIIKFCSSQYRDCQKYRELRELPDRPAGQAAEPPVPLRENTGAGPTLPVLGLFSLGATAAAYALDQLPLFTINLHLLALIFFAGALGQIASGLNALKSNLLQAVALTGFGLFWLSMLALDILPRAGYGELPGDLPMVGYLAMWGLFSLILCQGAETLARTSRIVFSLLTAFLLLLAVAHATGHTAILHTAALFGLASGLPGIILSLHHGWREAVQAMHPEMSRSDRVR